MCTDSPCNDYHDKRCDGDSSCTNSGEYVWYEQHACKLNVILCRPRLMRQCRPLGVAVLSTATAEYKLRATGMRLPYCTSVLSHSAPFSLHSYPLFHPYSHISFSSSISTACAMSLFDYEPGELSLLLNPSAKPDVYQWTKPAALEATKRKKRSLDSAEHSDTQSKKKRFDQSQSKEGDEQQSNSRDHRTGHARRQAAKPAAGEIRDENEADAPVDQGEDDEAVDDDGSDDETHGAQHGEDDDGEELSDLSDVDDSELYADMDASTARQLRKQKRLHEDAQLEQQHTNKPKPRNTPHTSPDTDPRLPRTLFVGNVPTTATRQQLARFFKHFGGVESCRLRSFSVSNPKLTKRVAMIKGAIHPESQSMNAYVVYETVEGVDSAVAKSGIEYEGHKLRLDYADKSKSTANKGKLGVAAGLSVFVGNLPFNVSEQQLYEVFDGCGELTGVRVVRDPLLALGKGFAFVTFSEAGAVKKALAMQGVAIDGRELRLTKAMDETKAREIRDKRRADAQPATSGAARRLQQKVKHAQRTAATAATAAGRGERKGKVYVGEVSNPLEFVQKARRVEKRQKLKKEERRKQRSLVKVKKPRMKPTTPDSDNTKAASKKASNKRERES